MKVAMNNLAEFNGAIADRDKAKALNSDRSNASSFFTLIKGRFVKEFLGDYNYLKS